MSESTHQQQFDQSHRNFPNRISIDPLQVENPENLDKMGYESDEDDRSLQIGETVNETENKKQEIGKINVIKKNETIQEF